MGLKKVLLAASALVLAAGVANAGYERDGWYVGLEGAWVSVADTDLVGSGIDALEFDNGWGAIGTVGYAIRNSNWRIEGEVGYRFNDAVAAVVVGPFGPYDNGELTEWSYMVNAVYDFKFSSERFGISAGVGLGMDDARLQFDAAKDRNYNFAAQGILGVTYRLSQHWDLALNYRYLWVDEPELVLDVPGAPFEVESAMELTKHTVSLGFRWGYEAPAAPPAPAPYVPPAPAPAPKQFIVFFGFNKCNITAEADAVLSEAASAAKSGGSASVRIVGHTDTVGSNSYNQKLSECRANAAKANMVGKGVSEGSISTSGKGESELMVQTGDSVKEPQNRRATVNLD